MLHVLHLFEKTSLFLRSVLISPCGRFVMIEFRIRCPDITIPRFQNAQAEIDVVEGHLKRFVQTSNLFKQFFSDHETGGSDGGEGLCESGSPKISWLIAREELVSMPRSSSAETQHNPPMLQRLIWIPQSRANRSHSGRERVTHHFREPIGRNHFDIVVDEPDQLPSRQFHRGIVKRREVKRAVVANYPYSRIGIQRLDIAERLGVICRIIDNEN